MAAGTEPGRYAIKTLLAAGEQPFADLDDDELDSLGKAIGRGPLDDPVSVSEDGILLDGHQRLKAMLRAKRTYIDASDVRIIQGVTRENALEKAVELNVRRRHLTVEQKADLARRLQRERRWSQATIARLFGVSRPAVSQWLAKTADEDQGGATEPRLIQGGDGKFYDREAVSNRQPTRPQRPPWHPEGYAFKGLAKARQLLRSEGYGGLPALQEAKLSQLLADVIEAAEALQNAITDDDTDRPGVPD
jgi:transcriptional regulator with XRE-family HTH domain